MLLLCGAGNTSASTTTRPTTTLAQSTTSYQAPTITSTATSTIAPVSSTTTPSHQTVNKQAAINTLSRAAQHMVAHSNSTGVGFGTGIWIEEPGAAANLLMSAFLRQEQMLLLNSDDKLRGIAGSWAIDLRGVEPGILYSQYGFNNASPPPTPEDFDWQRLPQNNAPETRQFLESITCFSPIVVAFMDCEYGNTFERLLEDADLTPSLDSPHCDIEGLTLPDDRHLHGKVLDARFTDDTEASIIYAEGFTGNPPEVWICGIDFLPLLNGDLLQHFGGRYSEPGLDHLFQVEEIFGDKDDVSQFPTMSDEEFETLKPLMAEYGGWAPSLETVPLG